MLKRIGAEFFGTAVLVYFAVGVATISFGFGATGSIPDSGIIVTALAFGLVLAALAYAIGPISGCHVNPAVTLGVLLSGRMTLEEAGQYWAAQFGGGIVGALFLWGTFATSPLYHRSTTGLGANGWGGSGTIAVNAGGAFIAETILTALFVFVILAVTRKATTTPAVTGIVIGLTLTVVHLIGIPITGTSVNPARSLGPAIIVGGTALKQLWLFILAPLVGGALAAGANLMFYGREPAPAGIESETPIGSDIDESATSDESATTGESAVPEDATATDAGAAPQD